ncbi:hypothetical protein DL771_006363 [Monosporascus sp. 5C6A]|nr:hypothetical protein DL771_006363 [Monosporascus sp. 5C6A]
MSASTQPSSSTSPVGVVDPLELLDFSEYDGISYHSPSVSPPATNKQQFARLSPVVTTPTTLPSSQPMSGPSHQYDRYKQQTPFVPGALASTLAVNQSNAHIGYTLEYIPRAEEVFDFNAPPSQASSSTIPDMDVDFESPADSFFFPESTIDPNAIGGPDVHTLPSPTVPSQTSNVGRMYPGMHRQQALEKAQAQQRQQQQMLQQQQQRQNQQVKQHRPKAPHPSDPLVEQKITQLLNSMRAKPAVPEQQDNSPLLQIPRPKKEEDDMDEDERLLASEEGKKLSSKERRQLRNKVSARAFRSRRKGKTLDTSVVFSIINFALEYISQLEAEIATKVTENSDLRSQNRALVEENRRLSDLTKMLLASPSFSNFLEHLSQNPTGLPQSQQQQAPKVEQRQQGAQQIPKDVNPYVATQHAQQQTGGMVMVPEQAMDFSMLNIEGDSSFNYQPTVFTVETPEMPEIDTSFLSEKPSHAIDEVPASDNEKVEAPVVESPVSPSLEKPQLPEAPADATSAKVVADLDGDIYDDDVVVSSTPTELDIGSLSAIDIFGGIEPEKAFARYELVDASEEEVAADMVARRVERLSAGLEASLSKLERLTIGL